MKASTGCSIAFMSAFLLVGFVALGFGLWNARRSLRAGMWPTVRGRLTDVSLKENSSGGSEGGPTFGVSVRYTYAVDGVTYEGSRLAFGYLSSSGRAAHDLIIQKLELANSVLVRYDPANPAVSCLSFGIHKSIRFVIAWSLMWLGFCLAFVLLCWFCSGSDDELLRNLSVE
jgi:hypothetical protein